MENTFQNQAKSISNHNDQDMQDNNVILIKNPENASENEEDLLSLIAEVVVENIVKKLRNGRHRIHKDQ